MIHGSIRARVRLGLSALALTLALVSIVANTALTRLGSAVATILRENYASVIACEDMKEALERQDSAAQFGSTGHEDIAVPMLVTHRAGFSRAFEREARNITVPGEGSLVRDIHGMYVDYVAAVDRVLAAPPGPDRADAYFRELLPRFTRIKDAVQRVLRMNQANMEHADREAKAVARRSVWITLGVSGAAVLFAVWFAWRLPRAIVRPVGALADAARAVGGGDLDVAIDVPTVQELAPLAEAFQKMVMQLRAYRQSSLGELLAAQDLANATVACLVDPVVVLGSDGDVLLTNRAASETFGLRPGSAEELRADDVTLPEAFARARDEVLTHGVPVAPRNFSEAMAWRDKVGERYFLVRATPLGVGTEGDRAMARVLVVAQDVTRFRRIDDLKSEMVATVSHEFKTPLTSLRMATHMLLEDTTGPLNEGQREIAVTARDDTERLRALVDELLDLVRIEAEAGALRRVPVDPTRLLSAAAEAHRAIAREKGVMVDVADGRTDGLAHGHAHGSPGGTVLADPEKLSIVLANLVSNAIRHTPAGGRVTLTASRDRAVLRLAVHDTGDGIEGDDLTRLLDRSASARRNPVRQGRHGLGLTIAQELVLQHGGELVARSVVGSGSEFAVVLPVETA